MSDTESLFQDPNPKEEKQDNEIIEPEEEPKPKKKTKEKKPMSEERRKRLLENLAKGRATSLQKRKEKKDLKAIKKADEIIETHKTLTGSKINPDIQELKKGLNDLKTEYHSDKQERKKRKEEKLKLKKQLEEEKEKEKLKVEEENKLKKSTEVVKVELKKEPIQKVEIHKPVVVPRYNTNDRYSIYKRNRNMVL